MAALSLALGCGRVAYERVPGHGGVPSPDGPALADADDDALLASPPLGDAGLQGTGAEVAPATDAPGNGARDAGIDAGGTPADRGSPLPPPADAGDTGAVSLPDAAAPVSDAGADTPRPIDAPLVRADAPIGPNDVMPGPDLIFDTSIAADSRAASEPVADDAGADMPAPSLDVTSEVGADASPDANPDIALDAADAADAATVDSAASDASPDAAPMWRFASMPYAAGAARAVVTTDGLHLLGGALDWAGSALYRDHWVLSGSTWSAVPADIPDSDSWDVHGHEYGGRLYWVGGWSGGNRLRMFDPGGNTWSTLRMIPNRYDYGFASGVMGAYLYAFGGHLESVTNATGHRYDFAMDRWFAVAPIPLNNGRGALSSAVVGTRLYVLNGNVDDGTTVLQIYDSNTNVWSTGASLPSHEFEGAAATVVGNEVYFLGGAVNHDASEMSPPAVVTNRVNIYDTVTNTWRLGPPMMVPRMWAAAATYQGEIHVLGGFGADSKALNSHEVLTP